MEWINAKVEKGQVVSVSGRIEFHGRTREVASAVLNMRNSAWNCTVSHPTNEFGDLTRTVRTVADAKTFCEAAAIRLGWL